ncbi:AAA family ATPase [Alkalimonas sp. MEB108]|uniref:AAA family ATPase n=1 Tax=Alkalimonas cellulosilytica TaxID=3058395 RepID=A0ABU7JA64_9GAMM|nr:hypothetical protein [Alkalimonas sp. MEB108]MEE2003387.1 AAA family ATPase [Alkalimonas sp. MEB108]
MKPEQVAEQTEIRSNIFRRTYLKYEFKGRSHMRKELKADLETNNSERTRPAFHRIGFNKSSIYLTKAAFYDARGWDHGRNSNGSYYLFSWSDWRAKGLLGFELGDESPALGKAILIGDYTPENDDIRDVKYSTNDGKAYFKSALAELSGNKLEDDTPIKIDVENFMKMKEIIPTGAQGKAIYGEGDYIIDGPAGTGKSTTVLQKIKLLELHEKVKPSLIKVVVKNSRVVPQFKALLKSINIDDISILPVKDFIEETYLTSPGLSVSSLTNLNDLAQIASKAFLSVFDIRSIFSISYIPDSHHWNELYELTKHEGNFVVLAEGFLKKAKEIRERKVKNDKTVSEKYTELKISIEQLKQRLTLTVVEKNKKSLFRKLGQKVLFSSSKSNDQLSLNDEANIRHHVDVFRGKKQKVIDDLKFRLGEELHIAEKTLVEQLDTLKVAYVKVLCESQKDEQFKEVLNLYFNKIFFNEYRFHTIIIDEAQDVSASYIELIRLCAENTILAGDESQNENPEGVGSWSKLAIQESFFKDKKLKVFQLRHNFRQTYELGNVSYNYRQLLLGRNLEDIKADYFDDQIGFVKPRLKIISQDEEFIELVTEQVQYINKSFSNSFPLVIFYENDSSLDRMQKLLLDQSLSYCNEDSIKSNSDILLVNIWEIAGREFPVVLAPLTATTSPSTIYIMLSRAKFGLTFFTGVGKKIDDHIVTLCQKGLIDK